MQITLSITAIKIGAVSVGNDFIYSFSLTRVIELDGGHTSYDHGVVISDGASRAVDAWWS